MIGLCSHMLQKAPALSLLASVTGSHAGHSCEWSPAPGAALPCALAKLGVSGPPDPVIVPFSASGVPVGDLPLGFLEPGSAQISCTVSPDPP